MSLLEVDNLAVNFTGGNKIVAAVRGVSFALDRGETLGIVGESGSGKSVTALSIMQLLPYPSAEHPSGSIKFQGQELCGAPRKMLEKIRGNRIAMVFQEPMTSLNPLHTVERQVAEVLFLHKKMSRIAARARVIELLSLVGIPQPVTRLASYPHELSGGQRQRVMIAMALANEPDILIADEPTTALDVTIQAQILRLLKDLQQKLGLALLLITHDLNIVRKMAKRVCVMRHGEIVEQGDIEQVFTAPRHPYTRQLLAAEPKGEAVTVAPDAPEILAADHVKVYFPIKRGVLRRTVDYIRAVDDVSLRLRAGETLGVVGESGSGKTTLGLALLRLLPLQGKVVFLGREMTALPRHELRRLRRDMQVVFQDPYGSLSPRLTIGESVAEGLKIHTIGTPAERAARVDDILREVGLSPEMSGRYPHEFSGGQRQRIAIARAMILHPKFIVLDEPTSALDMSVQAQIVDLLRDLQRKHGLGYLFISHDLRVVKALAHQVIVLKDGKVIESGSSEKIFAAPEQNYTKALMSAAFNLE
ncbi:MAG: ABC transporter ATP-binding protein [Alphaproteobacteria bacterium]